MASGSARKRFAREARAAAAIVHPHVMAIHSVDSSSRLPYLVMPYVSCESLRQRIDRDGPLELREILRIGTQTAAGLAAAHAQGLIHRDVKPGNVVLERGVDRVMLTDFGLARAADDASLTRTGVISGTPQFMSPEQARGDALDYRTDLFSLGSVLYMMCTGRPPFRAETSYGILRRITDTEPRPIREINPDIPAWLADIVDRLQQKNPDSRFQSAEEVADLLARWLAHVEQPTILPAPVVKPAANQILSRRAVVVVSAITALTMLAIAIPDFLTRSVSEDQQSSSESASRSVSDADETPRDETEKSAKRPINSKQTRWNDSVEEHILNSTKETEDLEKRSNQLWDDKPLQEISR